MLLITDLAEHIVLDDVTDAFYRTLCFSNFARSIHEPKSAIEKQLDQSLSTRLTRQLNWSSSICYLDSATHKISHFIMQLVKGRLTEQELNSQLEDNYWLSAALRNQDSTVNLQQLIGSEQGKINSVSARVIYQYFQLQLSTPYKYLAEQVEFYADSIVQQAEQHATEQELIELRHLACLNTIPFLILLMLLDKSASSIKQELLNQIGFECEQTRNMVKQYEPCAEMVLSFLSFDEFVKYHIYETLAVELHSNILTSSELELSGCSKLFLKSRTQVILASLSHIPLLTEQQKVDFSNQLGSKAAVNEQRPKQFEKVWKNLIPEQLEQQFIVNPSPSY